MQPPRTNRACAPRQQEAPAHAGGRDLGLSSPGPFPLAGHAVLLELAIRNLVENALAHTPPGTQVEVELDPAARWVQVSVQELYEAFLACINGSVRLQ